MKNTSKACSLTAALLTLGSLVGGANATTFVLDNSIGIFADGLNNGDAITQDGITLTLSNVVVSNGSGSGDVEGTGILISAVTEPTATDVISFSLTFSERVQILTYNLGDREDIPSGSFFTLSGSNGTSGNNSIPEIAGSASSGVQLNFDAGTIPLLEAGQAYSFTHNLSAADDALFNLKELNVVQVPEPSSATLLALGSLGILVRRKQRRCV